MRNKKLATIVISVLTAMLMIFTVSTTAFATEEVEASEQQPEVIVTEVQEEQTQAPQTESQPQEEQTESKEEESEKVEETEESTQAPTYYDVYGDDLPEVESQYIVPPTTVEIPDVEVSDTSLLYGVIAWLCVAVGIAVIAGVLVSQRTRQKTANNSRDTRRK